MGSRRNQDHQSLKDPLLQVNNNNNNNSNMTEQKVAASASSSVRGLEITTSPDTTPSQATCSAHNISSEEENPESQPSQTTRRRSNLWQRLTRVDANQRPSRPLSIYRRKSFLQEFANTKGPPQIALLMILVAIGVGSTIGVVPAVMSDRFARLRHGYEGEHACHTLTRPLPQACLQGSADAQTTVATSNLISNALTFLTSSWLGSVSDEHGRKFLLIAGMGMACIPPFLLWFMQLFEKMSPWWYYGFHASSGLINWIAVSFSALADVLPPHFRAPGIGLLMAGFMLGFSLAPILALLLEQRTLSFASFLVVFTGFCCTILYLPETLPPEIAAEARQRRRQQLQHQEEEESMMLRRSSQHFIRSWTRKLVKLLIRPFEEMSILNRSTFFRLISSLAFFSGMVSSGDQILLVYYLEERLGFTNRDVSIMFLVLGIMGLIAQAVLLKPLNDMLGEKNVVALAFLCGAIDNAMYGLAKNKATIFAALGVAGLTGMAFPTISAIKANNVAPSEQGRIQGALYSLQALASGLGPVSLKFVYSKAKDSVLGPGSMFLFASGLYLVAVGIACSLPSDKANTQRSRGENTETTSSLSSVDGDLDEYGRLVSSASSSLEEEDDYGTMSAAF